MTRTGMLFITLIFGLGSEAFIAHAEGCQNISGVWNVAGPYTNSLPSDMRELTIAQEGCAFFSDTGVHLLTGVHNANGGEYGELSGSDGCAMAVRLDNDRGQLVMQVYANAHGKACAELPITAVESDHDQRIRFTRSVESGSCQNISGNWTEMDSATLPRMRYGLNISQQGCRFWGNGTLLVGRVDQNGGMYGYLSSNNPGRCAMAVRLDNDRGTLKVNIFADAHGNACVDLPITPSVPFIQVQPPACCFSGGGVTHSANPVGGGMSGWLFEDGTCSSESGWMGSRYVLRNYSDHHITITVRTHEITGAVPDSVRDYTVGAGATVPVGCQTAISHSATPSRQYAYTVQGVH